MTMDYREHIARAVEYIEKNLKNEIDLAACAKACGYSKYYFLRIFKEVTGMTPADYIRKRRLSEIARRICNTDEYISEIAFAYGFNSKENFTRAFKAEFHILPSEYKMAQNSLKLYEPLSFETKPFCVIPEFKSSINNGIPAISWDTGLPEWGLITGYDEDGQMFSILSIVEDDSPASSQMPFAQLGKREIPLLSVLTITGKSDKTEENILYDTKKLAVSHLTGAEWSDENASGLEAYPALIRHFEEDFNPDLSWNMEYFLGTYGALKYYAWKYFEKIKETELATIYKAVFEAWQEAFEIKTSQDISQLEVRVRISTLLKSAHENEIQAVDIMSRSI